jgi:single-strand DNA-binding protein
MAFTLNEVRLIGNVGVDPDIRTTKDGKKVASFTIATSDVWRDKATGELKKRTEWHKIVVFIPALVAKIEEKVRKGTRLFLSGSLQTRKWQDQSSVDKYVTEILLQSPDSKMIILSGGNNHTEQEDDMLTSDDDDDIPF